MYNTVKGITSRTTQYKWDHVIAGLYF